MTNDTIIAVYLPDLLDAILGPTASHCSIPLRLARILEHHSTVCHVEFPSLDNNYELPHLWRLADWKTTYRNHLQRKEVHSRQRDIELRGKDLREIFLRQLCAATGLPRTMAEPLANSIIATRNVVAAAIYKVDIKELLRAEQELADYKQEKGMKA